MKKNALILIFILSTFSITMSMLKPADYENLNGVEEKQIEDSQKFIINDEEITSVNVGDSNRNYELQEKSTLQLSKTVFSVSPIDPQNMSGIIPLGALSPPSHVFPTDHIYFILNRNEGSTGPEITKLYSPGNLIVTSLRATQHIKAGITDYVIFLEPPNNQNISVMFIHVSSLAPEVFGDSSNHDWRFESEYTTGDETYKTRSKKCRIEVNAGEILGEVGGNPGQWALDMGVYDNDITMEMVANPERWEKLRYLHTVNPLDYYEEGAVLDELWTLVQRTKIEGDLTPCGSVLQDFPGTAQGCWFLSGVKETYPEDPHLALVLSNYDPMKAVFSVGTSISGLDSKRYEFYPNKTGLLNRDFKEIYPDGENYGYKIDGYNRTIILHMPDSSTLWIESINDSSNNNWVFSQNKTIFVR